MPIASGTHASDAPPAETGACDPAHDLVLFASSGATARLVRSMDWTDTPLGPLKDWPIGLRTLVDMLLGHPLPTLLLWGPEHAQIYNDGFARICDERKSEGLGRPTRLWWPEAWEIHGPIVRRIMAGGAPAYLEDQPLPSGAGSEGDERYFTITYSPAHEQSGAVGGVLITLVDTTGKVLAERVRREAEQALRDSEERYRLVSRATNEVIWDWHLPSDVLLWNEAVEQVFGHKLDHIPPLIEWWYEHIHPDDRERVIEAIQNVVEGGGGESWRDEYRFRRADESYATVFDRGFLQRDERGRPMRMIGSMLDLTERRHAEEELRQAKEQAEAASRAKDEFLAVLSHELRTPLTPVLMAVAARQNDPDLSPEVRADIAMIRRNVELETKLIDDLLDLSRITSGKLRLAPQLVDLNEAVSHVCGICRPQT